MDGFWWLKLFQHFEERKKERKKKKGKNFWFHSCVVRDEDVAEEDKSEQFDWSVSLLFCASWRCSATTAFDGAPRSRTDLWMNFLFSSPPALINWHTHTHKKVEKHYANETRAPVLCSSDVKMRPSLHLFEFLFFFDFSLIFFAFAVVVSRPFWNANTQQQHKQQQQQRLER
jgi:hypothetical protein